MDFRRAAQRYAALGSPADVAARIGEFRDAGLRHVVVDLVGPFEERDRQIERFATEVMPLLRG
jgi:alkanesulfonate monooxygenase SsuD/methylene tetrahydromethanopterin reductase-like flavin-dependent oxidoreductase (luciferase family)